MKFVRISYQFHMNFVATGCDVFIHTMGKYGVFVPNSYEFRTNWERI